MVMVMVMVMVIIINSPFVRLHGQTDQTEFDDLISALRSPLLEWQIYFFIDLSN